MYNARALLIVLLNGITVRDRDGKVDVNDFKDNAA